MYKVMLADEEGVALESLRVIIADHYSDICDIRLARNADQIFDIFQKFLPDLIFINIQMTGVKGIVTIRELHTKQRNCLFVVISYSSKIDFGREGTNMGIQNYLKKPLKRETIVPLCKDLFSMIDAEQKRQAQIRYNKQQLDEVIPMIESGMISEILFPDLSGNNLSAYCSLLDIPGSYGWVMDLKYSEITEHGTMCNPIGSVVQLSGRNTYFRKIIKAFFKGAIIGPVLANHVIVIMPLSSDALTESEKTARKQRASDMVFQMQKKLQMRFRFGFSEVYPITAIYPGIIEARNDIE